jgi:Asp-tRNA(Asn)/Glu-tRNA(Gln) amidotransferase A subunit family amidase
MKKASGYRLPALSANDPADHSAALAAALIRDGKLSSEELVSACLDRIAATEKKIQAWTFLDREYALSQARACDTARREGRPIGPLHGVPVGIKDIFDTRDMPTENGSALHAGRRPREDAATVSGLRQAGAVILGKTVTTEFAYFHPGKTHNPNDLARTPGGSSSGSAASVAAQMVPAALGSQTNGSVIRPAAYCGVCGFKPTHGMISRRGVLKLSRALDHVGVFARTVEDLALVADAIAGYDREDPDTRPAALPGLHRTALEAPPAPPNFAFVRTPVWDKAEPQLHAAFAELTEALGVRVREVTLDESFHAALPAHAAIMSTEMAFNLAREYESGRAKLSAKLLELLDRGMKVSAVEYHRALAQIPSLQDTIEELLLAYDAILTPAAPGEAPLGLESTGNPVFCTTWTLLGVPAVTLPLLEGENGMPIGVQLVGRRGDDGRLLRTARWLAETLTGRGQSRARRRN